MGALGTYVSTQSVFLLTAVLAVPALFVLHRVGPAPPLPMPMPATAARRGIDWPMNWKSLAGLRAGGCSGTSHVPVCRATTSP